MTATSGDALSHVNFQTRQNAVLTQISVAEFQPLASGKTRGPLPQAHRFLPYLHGGYEAASRNEPDRWTSFDHYLPKSFPAKR
jgi:hypothetical protein